MEIITDKAKIFELLPDKLKREYLMYDYIEDLSKYERLICSYYYKQIDSSNNLTFDFNIDLLASEFNLSPKLDHCLFLNNNLIYLRNRFIAFLVDDRITITTRIIQSIEMYNSEKITFAEKFKMLITNNPNLFK